MGPPEFVADGLPRVFARSLWLSAQMLDNCSVSALRIPRWWGVSPEPKGVPQNAARYILLNTTSKTTMIRISPKPPPP